MSKVSEVLKQIQADSIVFYMKLHNLHWNVYGLQFRQVHEATEIIYDKFSDIFDDCAERVLQLGNKPFIKLSDCLNNTKIKEEDSNKFNALDALKIVIEDLSYFKDSFKELFAIANNNDDNVTADYASNILSYIEKELWMLKSQLS